MQEHKQIQLYVGLEEGGCVDVGAIKLDGFTLIATSELEALKAHVALLQEAVRAVQSVPKRSGFAVNDPNPKAEMLAWTRLNEVMAATPEQCLAEIRAEAGRTGRAGFVAGYFHYKNYGFQFEEELEASADEYADKVRQSR